MGLDIFNCRVITKEEAASQPVDHVHIISLDPNPSESHPNKVALFERFKEFVAVEQLEWADLHATYERYGIDLDDIDFDRYTWADLQYVREFDEFDWLLFSNFNVWLKSGERVKVRSKDLVLVWLDSPTLYTTSPDVNFYQRKNINGVAWREKMKQFGLDLEKEHYIDYLFTQEMVDVAGECVAEPFEGGLQDYVLKPDEFIRMSY